MPRVSRARVRPRPNQRPPNQRPDRPCDRAATWSPMDTHPRIDGRSLVVPSRRLLTTPPPCSRDQREAGADEDGAEPDEERAHGGTGVGKQAGVVVVIVVAARPAGLDQSHLEVE